MNIKINLAALREQLKSYTELSDLNLAQINDAVHASALKRKCFECGEEQGIGNPACISCDSSPNLTDNSKPKRNELDKLFVGAPIVLNNAFNVARINYYDGTSKDNINRLPTLAESPANQWLAPWLERPDGLVAVRFLAWFKSSGKITNYARGETVTVTLWNDVKKIMILGD